MSGFWWTLFIVLVKTLQGDCRLRFLYGSSPALSCYIGLTQENVYIRLTSLKAQFCHLLTVSVVLFADCWSFICRVRSYLRTILNMKSWYIFITISHLMKAHWVTGNCKNAKYATWFSDFSLIPFSTQSGANILVLCHHLCDLAFLNPQTSNPSVFVGQCECYCGFLWRIQIFTLFWCTVTDTSNWQNRALTM